MAWTQTSAWVSERPGAEAAPTRKILSWRRLTSDACCRQRCWLPSSRRLQTLSHFWPPQWRPEIDTARSVRYHKSHHDLYDSMTDSSKSTHSSKIWYSNALCFTITVSIFNPQIVSCVTGRRLHITRTVFSGFIIYLKVHLKWLQRRQCLLFAVAYWKMILFVHVAQYTIENNVVQATQQ